MSTDHNRAYDELTDSELDRALAAASSELLAHVRAHADPAAALLTIMAAGESPEPRPPSGTLHPILARLEGLGWVESQGKDIAFHVEGRPRRRKANDRVLAAVKTRALARDLARAIDSACACTCAVAFDLVRSVALDHSVATADDHLATSLARADVRALDLTRALDLARAYASELDFDLGCGGTGPIGRALDPAGDHDFAIGRAIAHARVRAINLGGDVTSGCARARAIARDLARVQHLADRLNDCLGNVLDLIRLLVPGEIDASDADLSHTDLSDLTLLVGVIWTPQTIWPTSLDDLVALHSEEVAPDVYRVCDGHQRNRAGLVNI